MSGRTFAAQPKSNIQMLRALAKRILILHAVEQQRPIERGQVALRHSLVLLGEFKELLPDGTPLQFVAPG
jgi:hypothetical protein